MTVDKVTINSVLGENLTVEEYEEKLRGDLIEQEIKELYPRLSGEFARTLHRGYKSKWADPITKAVSGRYHSSEEIRKENAEMAAQTEAIRKIILFNMMENAGKWMSPKQLAKGTGTDLKSTSSRGSLSSAVSTLYPFLEKYALAERRPDPEGRGFVYCYKESDNKPSEIIEAVFENFQIYDRERMRLKRAQMKGENGPEVGTAEPKDPAPPQIPSPTVEVKDPIRDPIQGTVEQLLTLTQNGQALKVNVEFNVNIRFGLLKE